ncbi:NAD(P)-dependent oxidoreductase [Streptomyces sp. NPDC026672]|uniref:NAD(P)-dependent oxidoreductase n=1 Tax=unclassified Streptomyces TaxID=2593676 RepID=UPI0033D94B58
MPESGPAPLGPGALVGFIGLGNMGEPMTRRLAEAGYRLKVYDARPRAAAELAAATGAEAVASAADAGRDADAVVLMLPNSDVVESVVHKDGLLDALRPGAVLVDMGSSEPVRTRALAEAAAEHRVTVVDAPVSGGTRGAAAGTLTIMVGGTETAAAVRPLLEVVGSKVLHVGPAGAGHALKALNNLLSATHLLVTSEAILAGRAFGLDPEVMLEAINGSSGRSGSTENKWPRFMLDRSFDSGFGLRLMLKDMRIAVGLAETTGTPGRLGAAAARLWGEAAERLPADADHTEIVRWLEDDF